MSRRGNFSKNAMIAATVLSAAVFGPTTCPVWGQEVVAEATRIAPSSSPLRRFTPAEAEGGRLEYAGPIPIVTLQGSPREIGRQHAALLGPGGREVMKFPKKFIAAAGAEAYWPLLAAAAETLMLRAPQRYRDELQAAASHEAFTKEMREVIPVANTLLELRRLGCSAVAVEDGRTATDGPLVGRNFDFDTMGILDRYTVVFVIRPEGRHPFASIGFPGLGGVLSGMNEAGLSVATLDVERSADKSRKFDPSGAPMAFTFRQILEECDTVDEAHQLLQAQRATTWMNLIVCDRDHAAVFEITPDTVARRNASDGVAATTNHFRSEGLAVNQQCWRYPRLAAASERDDWDVTSVQELMHSVNQTGFTLQTMVFQPRTLQLHLSATCPPASDKPLTTIDLAPLFAGQGVESSVAP